MFHAFHLGRVLNGTDINIPGAPLCPEPISRNMQKKKVTSQKKKQASFVYSQNHKYGWVSQAATMLQR